MTTLLILNVVVLLVVVAILGRALRYFVARTGLTKWQKQILFVALSGILLTPIVLPVGIGLAVFAPSLTLLPFLTMRGAVEQIGELYSYTRSFAVPSLFLTLAASWWFGAKKYLIETQDAGSAQ